MSPIALVMFILKKKEMFGLFKKKSEVEKLELKYKRLLEEAHRLSTSNRSLSDDKTYEANETLKEIDKLKKKKEI